MYKCPYGKCECEWIKKIDEGVYMCLFPRCVKENGWLADKKNKNSENKK